MGLGSCDAVVTALLEVRLDSFDATNVFMFLLRIERSNAALHMDHSTVLRTQAGSQPKKRLDLGPNRRYSHRVAKKTLVFPKPTTEDPPVSGATLGSRVIIGIGNQRVAIDFYRKFTRLNPEAAAVVPIDRAGKPSSSDKIAKAKKGWRGSNPGSRTPDLEQQSGQPIARVQASNRKPAAVPIPEQQDKIKRR